MRKREGALSWGSWRSETGEAGAQRLGEAGGQRGRSLLVPRPHIRSQASSYLTSVTTEAASFKMLLVLLVSLLLPRLLLLQLLCRLCLLHLPSGLGLASSLCTFLGGLHMSSYLVGISTWIPAGISKSLCSTVNHSARCSNQKPEPTLILLPISHQVL